VEFLLRGLDAPVLPVVHDSGRFWRRDGKVAGTIRLDILPPLAAAGSPKERARALEALMNAARA
jgi:hypothetical protein